LAALGAIVGIWGIPAVLYAADHWERVEAIGGRLIGIFGRASSHAERVGVTAELQGNINGARREMQAELEGVLPHPVRIKFVRRPEDLAEIREGEVVLALGNHRRKAENLARATLAYTSTDLIRTARPYVDPAVLRSTDYAVAKRILQRSSSEALDYFLNTMWAIELDGSPAIRALAHRIDAIDRQGLLTRILLTEFLEIGRRYYPAFAPPGLHAVTLEFVDHLYRIVTKAPDEDLGGQLVFQSGPIRVGVVLVADRLVADRAGARPYVWRCLHDIKTGCAAVYLLARGSNTRLMAEVFSGLKGNGRVLDIGDPTEFAIETDTGPVMVSCLRVLGDIRGYGATARATDAPVASAS
jgi:hypothetical protein